MNIEAYTSKREAWYGPLREQGVFTWDTIDGEEYAVADTVTLSFSTRRRIAEASERLGRVYARVVEVARGADDRLLRHLGLPEATFGAVRLPMLGAAATIVGRFDFAMLPDGGLKMLEWNSDTPTSVVEAFHANGAVCRAIGAADPNDGMSSALSTAFRAAVDAYRETGYAIDPDRIVFAALDWHEEDAGTTKYLLREAGIGGRFVPLSALRVYRDRLCVLEDDGAHTPVDLLYRLHALEKLAEERDDDGYPTGAHVLDLVARRKLALINPPSAFIAQTKALQALIWSLHEQRTFFTAEEHDAIETYMLPTYMDNVFHGSAPYVRKPIFGREGGAVELFDANGDAVERDAETLYWEQPAVYQARVELPPARLRTLQGETDGRLLWGSFLVGGRPAAIVARVGGRITGNAAYYVPTTME